MINKCKLVDPRIQKQTFKRIIEIKAYTCTDCTLITIECHGRETRKNPNLN